MRDGHRRFPMARPGQRRRTGDLRRHVGGPRVEPAGYSPVDDQISQLAAIGASSRPAMTLGHGGLRRRGAGRGAPAPVRARESVSVGWRRRPHWPRSRVAALPLGTNIDGAHAAAAALAYGTLAATPLVAARAAGRSGPPSGGRGLGRGRARLGGRPAGQRRRQRADRAVATGRPQPGRRVAHGGRRVARGRAILDPGPGDSAEREQGRGRPGLSGSCRTASTRACAGRGGPWPAARA